MLHNPDNIRKTYVSKDGDAINKIDAITKALDAIVRDEIESGLVKDISSENIGKTLNTIAQKDPSGIKTDNKKGKFNDAASELKARGLTCMVIDVRVRVFDGDGILTYIDLARELGSPADVKESAKALDF